MSRRIIVPVKEEKKQNKGNRGARTEKQKEALKKHQFQPGQSGNPSGRPKGTGTKKVTASYEAWLGMKVPKWIIEKYKIEIEGEEVTWADIIGLQVVMKAVGLPSNVNFTALTEIREATEGKIPDRTELSGKDGTPLQAPTFAIPVEFVDPKKETNDDNGQSEEDSK